MPIVETCALWRDPETITRARMADHFERLETVFQDSHEWRYVLKCRECGQMYVFDFHEEIDWAGGNDPQYTLWIPVPDGEDPAAVAREDRFDLMERVPRVQSDWPTDADRPRIIRVPGPGD